MTTAPNHDDVLRIARDWVAAVASTDPTHECVIMGKHIIAAHEARERARAEMPEVMQWARDVIEWVRNPPTDIARDRFDDAAARIAHLFIVAHEELAELRAERETLEARRIHCEREWSALLCQRDATLARIDTELSGVTVTCSNITDDDRVNRIRSLRTQVVRDEMEAGRLRQERDGWREAHDRVKQSWDTRSDRLVDANATIATLRSALTEACSIATTHRAEDRARIIELRKLARGES